MAALAVLWLGVCGFVAAATAAETAETAAAVTPTAASSPSSEQSVQSAAAALRVANERFAANDREGAEALLIELSSDSIIADYALLLWMRSRVESGRTAEAIGMQPRWDRLDSPLDADFFTLLGRAYASEGAEAQARQAWERALKAEDRSEELAALHTSIGASNERTKRFSQAAQAYLQVWIHHPETDSHAAAERALGPLEARLGRKLRHGAEYRKRGDTLFRLRHNEAALDAYDRAIAAKPSPTEVRRAERKRAQTLFRLRRYPEAARAFKKLPAQDETAIEIARAHARSGEVTRAIEELAAIGRRTRSRHSVRANFLAGLLADEDEPVRARSFFEKTIARGGRTSYARAAVWRLGWSSFRAGEYAEAIGYFNRLIGSDESLSSLRPRYWHARALERSGLDGAEEIYMWISSRFPFSYYGWRAQQRSRAGLPDATDAVAAHEAATPLDSGTSVLSSVSLARVAILIEAGMVDEANAELTRLFAIAGGLTDRLVLAQMYADTGDFHRAQKVVLSLYGDKLASRPALSDLDVWWHAWPAPYPDAFRQTAEKGIRVEPGLVYAVMREESGYRPKVLSVSGARGLLQIMPETGEVLARGQALHTFTPEDLFDPETNIHLGSAYLEQLLSRFSGRVSAAVASYNAGPEAVARWIESGPSEDDEWVEAIPYDQTRTYVERVLRSLQVYRVLY